MSDLQAKLDYSDAIADWFLEAAEAHSRRGELEESLKYTFVAAAILYKHNRSLSSARLEANLRYVASQLPVPAASGIAPATRPAGKEVCLHVMNESIPAGGHMAMAKRWMGTDGSRIHCVALLGQGVEVPKGLIQAVTETGGTIYAANPNDSFSNRAIWLRNLANNLASHVVLHVNTTDVISGAAFGVDGGPPVMTVNHSAHTFWTGATVTDLTLNCRGSALEGHWTGTYRGTTRYATVPIPLVDTSAPDASRARQKLEARESLGIPADAIVILTVGAYFKFLPVDDIDFVGIHERILEKLPNAYLLAVGFNAAGRWSEAAAKVGSRIRALGAVSQAQLGVIHSAADIYAEGFPFGTTTALLEAALKGIPVVLSPAQCPPPYGSDGVALDDVVERSSSLAAYEERVIRLATNATERAAEGEKIRESVARHHSGPGWRAYLEDAIRMLPPQHTCQATIAPVRTPDALHEYWARFVEKIDCGYEETLERSVARALSMGLRPRPTESVIRACRKHRSVRINRTIPLPVLIVLCRVMAVLPIEWARRLFRFFSAVCRASFLARVLRKVARLFGAGDGGKLWWEDYRRIRE